MQKTSLWKIYIIKWRKVTLKECNMTKKPWRFAVAVIQCGSNGKEANLERRIRL